MFLYLLNENEGMAFMELAVQAMTINNKNQGYEEAECETYLTELNIPQYKIQGLPFADAAAVLKQSTTQIKRCVIIELCGILYSDKEIDKNEMEWIYSLSEIFELAKTETDRLIRWSKDFSDFLEVGLMYINAKA